MDYSKPYRDVPFFGLWAEEAADDRGKEDAAAVLCRAVERCAEQDMRADPETIAALRWLASQGHYKRAKAFRLALDTPDPETRQVAVSRALDALRRDLPGL